MRSVGNISTWARGGRLPGGPPAPDVICHSQTPPLQEPPRSRCHSAHEQPPHGSAAAGQVERRAMRAHRRHQPASEPAVAAASGAASVRVWHITSRGWDPWTERPLPEVVRVAYPLGAVAYSRKPEMREALYRQRDLDAEFQQPVCRHL